MISASQKRTDFRDFSLPAFILIVPKGGSGLAWAWQDVAGGGCLTNRRAILQLFFREVTACLSCRAKNRESPASRKGGDLQQRLTWAVGSARVFCRLLGAPTPTRVPAAGNVQGNRGCRARLSMGSPWDRRRSRSQPPTAIPSHRPWLCPVPLAPAFWRDPWAWGWPGGGHGCHRHAGRELCSGWAPRAAPTPPCALAQRRDWGSKLKGCSSQEGREQTWFPVKCDRSSGRKTRGSQDSATAFGLGAGVPITSARSVLVKQSCSRIPPPRWYLGCNTENHGNGARAGLQDCDRLSPRFPTCNRGLEVAAQLCKAHVLYECWRCFVSASKKTFSSGLGFFLNAEIRY